MLVVDDIPIDDLAYRALKGTSLNVLATLMKKEIARLRDRHSDMAKVGLALLANSAFVKMRMLYADPAHRNCKTKKILSRNSRNGRHLWHTSLGNKKFDNNSTGQSDALTLLL
uniref:Uncharacterized protein n=1 Tax=Spongospora subterranea TaxID=70186 RepID=A0A0H5RCK9_9EUKA|eukprot:CRZ11758.1 hypothetical protein [Spongospora subterranea]